MKTGITIKKLQIGYQLISHIVATGSDDIHETISVDKKRIIEIKDKINEMLTEGT